MQAYNVAITIIIAVWCYLVLLSGAVCVLPIDSSSRSSCYSKQLELPNQWHKLKKTVVQES